MMLYTLIIFAFAGGQGVAVTTAEYSGEENCLIAAAQVNKMSTSFRAICTKRGR